MTVDEYRHRTIDLAFPSGLVLTIQPPKVKAMMDVARGESDAATVMANLLKLVEATFPVGFTLDDLNDPKDWAYLQEWVGGFFQAAVPGFLQKSSSSSNSDTSPQGSGPTTS
jgi:hypothetical protein